MKKLTKFTALMLALLFALALPVNALAATAQSVAQQAKSLGSKYGVTVFTDTVPSYWQMNVYYQAETSYDRLEKQLNVLDNAFARYPSGFFKSANLVSVTVVRAISYTPRETNAQIQAITMSAYTGNMYMIMRSDADRYVYDHEISHLIDEFPGVSDTEWSRLNVPGFKYTGGFISGDVLPPGIVTGYSGWAPYEDRAEVFAGVMDDSKLAEMRALASHDAVLRQKLTLLRKYIGNSVNSKSIVARIDELLATPDAVPSTYVTSTARGRTGPGNQYPEVNLDTSKPMGVVQRGSQYVKVLVDGVGVYFPASSVTQVSAPAQPEQPAQPEEPAPTEPTETPELEAAAQLASIGMAYTNQPAVASSVTGKQVTDAKVLEKVLGEVYKIARKDGFANANITVVTGLAVKGAAQPYAYLKGSKTMYVDADKFTVKAYTAFNKQQVAKYGSLAA